MSSKENYKKLIRILLSGWIEELETQDICTTEYNLKRITAEMEREIELGRSA